MQWCNLINVIRWTLFIRQSQKIIFSDQDGRVCGWESCPIRERIRALEARAWTTASASSSASCEHSLSSPSSATLSLSHALCSSCFICSSLSLLFLSSLSNSSFLFLNDNVVSSSCLGPIYLSLCVCVCWCSSLLMATWGLNFKLQSVKT